MDGYQERKKETTQKVKIFFWNILFDIFGMRTWSKASFSPLGNKVLDVMKLHLTDSEWSSPEMNALRSALVKDENARKFFLSLDRKSRMVDFLTKYASDVDIFAFQEITFSDVLSFKSAGIGDEFIGCRYDGSPFLEEKEEREKNYPGVAMLHNQKWSTTERGILTFKKNGRSCVFLASHQVVIACVHVKGFPVSDSEKDAPLSAEEREKSSAEEQKNLEEAAYYAENLNEFYPNHCIIIAGDFNHPLSFSDDGYKTDSLSKIMKNHGYNEDLTSPYPTSLMSESTYVNPREFTIDRCFVRNGYIETIECLREGLTLSDHTPLIATINVQVK